MAVVIAAELLKWFEKNKRDLPWRKLSGSNVSKRQAFLRDPYRVWVSEIMLQQTQVKTVIPYFEKWLQSFPNLKTFADAELDDVLKHWEGLGYYRRARNFHKAAQVVMQDYGGKIPATSAELMKLSGIGSYTSAAIASLAFGEDVLAVDGNVKRVASRLFCLSGDVSEKEVKAYLEPQLPKGKAGAFNEALMELGATICTAKNADCVNCPLKKHCLAFKKDKVAEFPTPKVKKQVPHKTRFASIYISENQVWLHQRDDSGMLAGLWGFPLSEEEPIGEVLLQVKHAYTHFKITVTPVRLTSKPTGEGSLVALESIDAIALSTLDHKILAELKKTIDYKG